MNGPNDAGQAPRGGRFDMWIVAFLALLLAGVSWSGQADTDHAVFDERDPFTDERILTLVITAVATVPASRSTRLVVQCDPATRDHHIAFARADVPAVDVDTGVEGDRIRMRYRFDDKEAKWTPAEWHPRVRLVFPFGVRDHFVARLWLSELHASETLIVQFGSGRVARFDLAKTDEAVWTYLDQCEGDSRTAEDAQSKAE